MAKSLRVVSVLVALARCGAVGASHQQSLPTLRPEEWLELKDLAEKHNLAPLCCSGMARAGVEVPRDIADAWRKSARASELRNLSAWEQLQAVLQRCERSGIPTAVLKGASLAAACYPTPGLRPYTDLDILVPISLRERALEILLDLGYSEYQPDAVQDRKWFAENHHHWRVTRHGGLPIELHWALSEPCSDVQFDMSQVLAHCREYSAGNGRHLALSPEDQILHLAIHSCMHECRLPLRQFLDLTVLLAATPEIDWSGMLDNAHEIGATRDLHLFLGIADQLTLVDLPQAVRHTVRNTALPGTNWRSLASYAVFWPYVDTPSCLVPSEGDSARAKVGWRSLVQLVLPPAQRRHSAWSEFAPAPARTGTAGGSWLSSPKYLLGRVRGLWRDADQIRAAIAINRHFLH